MKTYLTILTICFVLFAGNILAQCPSGSIDFNSQQEVDDFALNYPNCTQILGSLSIGGNLNNPISNLNGLSGVVSVANNLNISSDSLTSLVGLENLNSIGGGLYINDSSFSDLLGLDNLHSLGSLNISTTNLTSLSGLENLNSIEGDVYFFSNYSLTSLSGLENLNSIGGRLDFWENFALTNLSGLENLNSIGGDFFSSDNGFANLEGLNNLTTIGGNLYIENLLLESSLVNLEGLNNLKTVGGNLRIYNMWLLSDISALSNLISIGGYLHISETSISDLSALENIDYTSITDLTIQGNSQLSFCGVKSICNYLVNGGNAIISNVEGCNTVEEIIQSCSGVWDYAVEGNIFMDENDNCLKDTTELDLSGWLVEVKGASTHYAYTHDNGTYVTPVDTGRFTVTAIPPNALWENTCPEEAIVNINDSNLRDTIDFGANSTTFCPLLEIDITSPFVRRKMLM